MEGDDKQNKASSLEVALKWISSIVIGILFLVCLTYSKLTLLALSNTMHAINKTIDLDGKYRLFVLLQIISIIPNIVNLIRGIWHGILRKDRKWPKMRTIKIATFLSIIETIGICLFIFCIPGLSKTYHVVLLMSCVIILPICANFYYTCRQPLAQCRQICMFTSVIFCLAGIGFTIYSYLNVNKNWWYALVGVLCLSVAWIPSIQKRKSNRVEAQDGQSTSNSDTQEQSAQDRDEIENNTTWRLTALMSIVKIISTFGISILIFFIFEVDGKGYFVGYIACTTHSQIIGFSIPLSLATPLSICILLVKTFCQNAFLVQDKENYLECSSTENGVEFIIGATALFFLAHCLFTWRTLYKSKLNIMLKEDQLFWTPMYNSALLDQWILLMRRNSINDSDNICLNPRENAEQSKLYICTTMYRENKQEMKQLLESFRSLNDKVSNASGLQCQFFIFFDNAVKAGNPKDYLVQLVVLFEEVFVGMKAGSFIKTETPFGMSLAFKLLSGNNIVCNCTIYLKDNTLVKSKKRWSQVMYMKYLLEKEIKRVGGENKKSYILTTDADVKFTPKSVEALLDLMSRDDDVGAVCARTHPLGSGFLVWYQVFEYAIGHWFLKASEHVLGTVLCSPGCFSVFRCKALNDVVEMYATDVEKAEEFLTKDMGEDRWLCTLLVQKGWRIEYCATASNSTFCPESFDEFFKQRRRWIVSTLANQWLLIKEWSDIKRNNKRVPFLFKIYQIVLLVSTLIGPSSVMLVVTGGLKYGEDWNPKATLPTQVVASIIFCFVCLYSSQKTQLMVAKLYSCLYTLFMIIAIVGTAVEIVSDIDEKPGAKANFISEDIRISTTSAYLIGMAGIFVTTAVLHLNEFWTIFYGFIYLLGLPSGYLILMIYSICNITDRSWGTRDDTHGIVRAFDRSWQEYFQSMFEVFRRLTSCCPCHEIQDNEQQNLETENETSRRTVTVSEDADNSQADTDNTPNDEDATSVDKWLKDKPTEAALLKRHGFENRSLISGITKKELKHIGIKDKITLSQILRKVESLPEYEIPVDIPVSVNGWLQQIGLEQYKGNFEGANIKDREDLEILTVCTRDYIKNKFNIRKIGHIKRLLIAIEKLQRPSKAQKNRNEVRNVIVNLPCTSIESDIKIFWKKVKNDYLAPRSSVYQSDEHLKGNLRKVRNKWLIVFAMINVLWLILISTLANEGKILGVFGSNPVGFAVVVVYGAVLVIQFLAMIVHRLSTFLHYLGTLPYKCNSPYHSSWVFPMKNQEMANERDYP